MTDVHGMHVTGLVQVSAVVQKIEIKKPHKISGSAYRSVKTTDHFLLGTWSNSTSHLT